MKRLQRYWIIILALSSLLSCAPLSQQSPERVDSLSLVNISDGLPQRGEWRQNIVLADMDGDGFLDIVAPPPRSAQQGQNQPHIFLRDRKESRWKEGVFTFPTLKGYGYGGIAVGDINRDGYQDIVLAVYRGRIILLENNKSNGFVEKPFPVEYPFNSRMVEVNDINGDGLPDIIALPEAPDYTRSPSQTSQTKGILIGINRQENGWELKTIPGSGGLFGDSMAIGDIKGAGNKDIIIAPLTALNNNKLELIWFGDGKGNFSVYEGDLISSDKLTYITRAGDLNGNGKDAVIFKVSGFDKNITRPYLSAYEWTGAGFADISKGLEMIEDPIVFDLADIEGNGKKELIVLSPKGLSIYKHTDQGWVKRGHYQISSAETENASDLKAERNKDGSLLIVYSRGIKGPTYSGIKAYLLK